MERYEFLIGLEFEDVIEALNLRGVYYDFGELELEEARDYGDCYLYIGGMYCDNAIVVDFEDGLVIDVFDWE